VQTGSVEMYDEYAVYQQRTRREIPVVILSPDNMD
jgi:hypothetical protein